MGLASDFGRNVRAARHARGMTLEALALEAGLAYSYVGELERGRRNPTLKIVEQISGVLGISPIELLAQNNQIRS